MTLQTRDYNNDVDAIINEFIHVGNITKDEIAANHYIKTTLKMLQKDTLFQLTSGSLDKDEIANSFTYPFLKKHDFSKYPLPIPNSTLLNKSLGNYEGNIFQGNTGLALELFSAGKYDGRLFVPLSEVNRLKLNNLIDLKDIININIKNKYTDPLMSKNRMFDKETSVQFVNAEAFLKTSGKKNGLTKEQLLKYFPDFDNQKEQHSAYANKNKINYSKNDKTDDFSSVKNQIKTGVENSVLPKLTAEICHFKECQLKNTEHTPLFSPKEHLDDMIKLYEKNPQELKNAILQAGYIMQHSMNRLFSEDISAKSKEQYEKQVREGTREENNVRKPENNNVNINVRFENRGRGR